MLSTKFAVIGVGRYGAEIARKLAVKGAEVYAFDNDESKINLIKDDVAFSVTLDSTDHKALISQKINQMDAVVVSIGENFEAVILTAAHLIDLGVKRIIARASGEKQKMILEKIGVTEILAPEDEVASLVAERLINPNIVSFLQLPDDYEIAEIKAPNKIANRTVADIGIRDKYSLTLITLKREFESKKDGETVIEVHIVGVPTSETIVQETDTLVVFGTTQSVERFIEINM